MTYAAPQIDSVYEWLNQEHVAFNGKIFVPSDDVWRPDTSVNSSSILAATRSVSRLYQVWIRVALVYYAKARSPKTLFSLASILKRAGDAGFNILDEYKVVDLYNRFNRGEFSQLRGFLKFWHSLDEVPIRPGSETVAEYAKFREKKIDRVCPVASQDPIKGPLTPYETESLYNWANEAFADGRISMERYVYIRLLISYGSRRTSCKQMVFGDIKKSHKGNRINIPLAKKGLAFRGGFEEFGCTEDLYQVLVAYKKYVYERLCKEYPGKARWDVAINNVPLFRRASKGRGYSPSFMMETDTMWNLSYSADSVFHKSDRGMAALIDYMSDDASFPVSERTGEKLHVTAHRLRYTLGTDMAREGYSEYAIAEALTHASINEVGKYIKTSVEMAKRIDEKLKDQISLVVNAFTGKIVSQPEDAFNSEKPSKLIRDGADLIATCGSISECYLDAPYACYGCSKFQAHKDAPHEKALKVLESRQEMAAAGGAIF